MFRVSLTQTHFWVVRNADYPKMFFLESVWVSHLGSWTCQQNFNSLRWCGMCVLNLYYDCDVSGSIWPANFILKGRCTDPKLKINICILCQFLNYPLRIFKFFYLADAFIWRNICCIVNFAGNRTHALFSEKHTNIHNL